MAETRTLIYCPDIACESCESRIRRRLEGVDGVDGMTFRKDSVEVVHHARLPAGTIVAVLRAMGYRADTAPFSRKTFRERLRDLRENRSKYLIELRMLAYSGLAVLGLIGLQVLVHVLFLRDHADFVSRYAWWIFYLDLAVVSIGAAMWHLRAYRATLTTMVGMMVGMTFGMQSGLMLGAIIGATNGIFVGGMTGMLSATLIGILNGKCCGIMGVLEGMMAGMMNGIMGGMIGTMFFADHILWFMPFFIAINMAVMWGLSYMLFEEVEERPGIERKPMSFAAFFSWCVLLSSALFLIMMFAPRSGLSRLV